MYIFRLSSLLPGLGVRLSLKLLRRKSMTKERTRKGGGQRHLLVRSSNDAFDDLSLAQKFDLYEDGTGEDMQRLLSASRPKPKLK